MSKADLLDVISSRSVLALFAAPDDLLGHCIRIILKEKDINPDIHYVTELPNNLKALNPYNSVLTLVDQDMVLYEAGIIMEYLDERFPYPPLLPVEPIHRAQNRQLRYRIMKDIYSLLDDLNRSGRRASAARKLLKDHLTAIAPVFKHKPYFTSDEYTLADCCMAPVLWRLSYYEIKLPPVSAKLLLKYANKLFNRDAFQASLSDADRELNQV